MARLLAGLKSLKPTRICFLGIGGIAHLSRGCFLLCAVVSVRTHPQYQTRRPCLRNRISAIIALFRSRCGRDLLEKGRRPQGSACSFLRPDLPGTGLAAVLWVLYPRNHPGSLRLQKSRRCVGVHHFDRRGRIARSCECRKFR